MSRVFLVATAVILLSGCFDSASRADRPEECGDGQEWHTEESYCADAEGSDAEICNAWLEGKSSETVQCTARSRDGRVTLTTEHTLTGSAVVTVRDGAGTQVWSKEYDGVDEGKTHLGGETGDWTLTVAFQGANGFSRFILFG